MQRRLSLLATEAFFLALALGGIALSLKLSLSHYLNIPLTCSGIGDCEKVLTHPWSEFLGRPVSDYGVAGFALLALTALFNSFVSVGAKHLSKARLILAASGLAISGVLQYVAFAVIRALCIYCLASSGIILLLFVLSLYSYKDAKQDVEIARLNRVIALSMISISALAVLRIWDDLRWSVLDSQTNLAHLQQVSPSSLTGDDDLAIGPLGANNKYVAFYSPTCGGCAKSFREASKRIATMPSSRLIIRLSDRTQGSLGFRVSSMVNSLARSQKGLQVLEEWFSGHDLSSAREFEQILSQYHVSTKEKAPKALKTGAEQAETSFDVLREICQTGPPLVILVTNSGVKIPVNPLTLEPYN